MHTPPTSYPGGADYCASQHASCLDCSNAEDACRAAGASTNYSNSIECTTAAQICYHNAFGAGTVNGAYSCEQAHNTCVTARGTNFSFCASQEAACTPCVQEENECRTAPGANQSYCASQAAECWGRAMEG